MEARIYVLEVPWARPRAKKRTVEGRGTLVPGKLIGENRHQHIGVQGASFSD